MRLDELINQTTVHEQTPVTVDRRVTMASRTALACCAAAALIFNRTKVDDATDIPGFLIDWAGYPTAGFTYTCFTLLAGLALALVTKGFTQANEHEHKAVVGFTIAAAITVVPIVLAVAAWVVFIALIILFLALSIGFWVLVLWAFTQIN